MPALGSQLDPASLRQALTPWLAERLGAPDLTITDSTVPKQGFSNETVLLDAEWGTEQGRFVLRMQPAASQIFLGGDAALQHAMTSAVGRHGVAAPTCRWFEPDSSLLGTPFYVMDRVEGRTPADVPGYNVSGWVTELSTAERRTLWDSAMDQLARIHALDPTHQDFAPLRERCPGATGLDTVLGHLGAWCRVALHGRAHATIEPAMAWLAANLPASVPPLGISWGDARIGNMIFADDLSVAAVTDWEMASLAPAEVDLGWWVFMDEWSTQGAPRLEGLPDRATTLGRHEAALGRPLHDLHWYEVLAGARHAVAMVRVGDLMVRAGMTSDDTFVHVNPVLAMLASRLDLPAPARP